MNLQGDEYLNNIEKLGQELVDGMIEIEDNSLIKVSTAMELQ